MIQIIIKHLEERKNVLLHIRRNLYDSFLHKWFCWHHHKLRFIEDQLGTLEADIYTLKKYYLDQDEQ